VIGISMIVRSAFRCAQLGFGIDAELAGKGSMREALKAAIAYAFGSPNHHRLGTHHQPQNVRSAALQRRLRFVPTGSATACGSPVRGGTTCGRRGSARSGRTR
jgi:ribosomal-protein-alanine N-acetyltransferase